MNRKSMCRNSLRKKQNSYILYMTVVMIGIRYGLVQSDGL